MSYAKIQRVSRDKIECDLELQGFVILENRLKTDTTSVITSLIEANIRTIMVTGDNILTALSVAKDCGMVAQGQSIITVNTRPDPNKIGFYEIYYNLAVQSGYANRQINGDAQTPNGCGADYELMTNSNSVTSFETMNTVTNRDVENGCVNYHLEDEDDEIKMADELPNNNYRFAMIGKTWSIVKEFYPELIAQFVTRGTVFARMSPDQKQSLILELQDIGYYVAMCGDGANDCGALKAAHTGISLSEAESSVASPFTSKSPTIACVPNVIKEGRAALVTSFGIFKYMAAYSLVQFVSVLILYSIDSNLTDFEFLYIDLFMISIFAFFFGKTESYDGPLVKQAPLNSLISLSPIASIVFHMLIGIIFQVVGWYHLRSQDWFVPFDFSASEGSGRDLGCYENYTIFIISCFQYIILAFIFSKGKPYRKSILSNYGFLVAIIVNTIFTLYLTISPNNWIIDLFGLVVPEDTTFRLYLIGYGVLNLILAIFIELFVIEFIFFKKLRYRFHNITKSRRKFLLVENQMRLEPAWPPLSLYQTELTVVEKISPTSYAEIAVAHGTDISTPFDENSCVLNSFFDVQNEKNYLNSERNDSGIGFENVGNLNENLKPNYLPIKEKLEMSNLPAS